MIISTTKSLMFFSLVSLILGSCSTINQRHITHYSPPRKLDTISAFFLYEINVPYICYSRPYQIEQDGSLIAYSDEIKNVNIKELYKKGLFTYSITNFVSNYIDKQGISLPRNKSSISKFQKLVSPAVYSLSNKDSIVESTLVHDKTGLLSYKKVYAKMVVADLGKLDILVPNTDNFKCCYSNQKKESMYFSS